ncbi:Oidioi.mRNA.OKI2018_I69.PAR.g10758.t1.cds [Oikopleura dioica]|uniref:Oidioi.mRNA.OKI2018_I69.PAR.g10758.t1.cds n=1 Tax=Oikopleura dioica TaxID=34765 RepID=A0ABN7RS67_OIKDI|nr:Oidioi.mRNA.OKI2018_I69.PAR.g10758.t1.cds [Oikopleura dioica]
MQKAQWLNDEDERSHCNNCEKSRSDWMKNYDTDAIFSCPRKNCNKDLTFDDFFKMNCCEEPVYGHKFEKLKKLQSKAFENCNRKCKLDAEIEAMGKKLEELQIERKNLEEESLTTNVELLTLTTEICGKDVKNKFSCEVCFEAYNATDHIEIAIPCGHRFCLGCLNLMEEKICPTCRNAFNDDQMIKLF